MKKFIILALVCCSQNLLSQQIDTLLTFGSEKKDDANGMYISDNNEVFIIGYSENFTDYDKDYFVVELDQNSDTIRTFIQKEENHQIGKSISIIQDNNRLILGSTYSPSGNTSFIRLSLFDEDYQSIWSKEYMKENDVNAKKMLVTDNNDIIILSEYNNTQSMHILYCDENGEVLWEKSQFDPIFAYTPRDIIELENNSFMISGWKSSSSSSFTEGYLMQIDKEGNLLWEETFSLNGIEVFYGIKETDDNNIIVCGTTFDPQTFETSVIFNTYNSEGQLINGLEIPQGSTWTQGIDLEIDEDYNVYLLCYVNNTNRDILLLVFDKNGNQLDSYIYGGTEDDFGRIILIDGIGNLNIVGSTTSYGNGSMDMLYVKLINRTITSNVNQTKSLESITVFPNPSSNYLNIKCDKHLKEILLFANNGALIKTLDPNIQNSINELSSGNYFIRALTNNGTVEIIPFVKAK